MNHFAYPLAFLLLLLPFIIRRFFPAVKGLHGDALRIPFINDIATILYYICFSKPLSKPSSQNQFLPNVIQNILTYGISVDNCLSLSVLQLQVELFYPQS